MRVRGRLAADAAAGGRGVLELPPALPGQKRRRLGRNPGTGPTPAYARPGAADRAVLRPASGRRRLRRARSHRGARAPAQTQHVRARGTAGTRTPTSSSPVLDCRRERHAKKSPARRRQEPRTPLDLDLAVRAPSRRPGSRLPDRRARCCRRRCRGFGSPRGRPARPPRRAEDSLRERAGRARRGAGGRALRRQLRVRSPRTCGRARRSG